MLKKVSSWVDLVQSEHKILNFWKENNIFEKLRKINEGKPCWSFLDGPLTANNPMGVHHAWGRTLKDVYQRFWAMNRRELRYQNGFDCQGLWVEVEMEKKLGFTTKADIEKFGIDKFVERCKERVHKYAKVQTDQSIRLGYWMDWDNSYYTMSDENNYTIWSFLKKCHKRGLIYKGHDVMPFCVRCGTGMSQHEMQEGYKEVRHLSVVIRFPVKGRAKEALLVWTTTPWTLTSNVALAVNPKVEYIQAKQGEWTYYLSKECAEKILVKGSGWKIVRSMSGVELDGLSYDGPFDEIIAQEKARLNHRVVLWKEVSDVEGTGIVHIAPGCGKEDHDLGKQLNLLSIEPIDESGVFEEGFGWLTGKKALDVASDILRNLEEKGILYSYEDYKHSYPHCWRCGTELLFRLVDEWFIRMDPWREEIMEIAKKVRWIPSFGLELELDWLRNMHDWMISKKRYWGLALPIWECDKCGSFQVIGGREELKDRAVSGWNVFVGHTPHRPWIDQVKIVCDRCGKVVSRIEDVGNPWLDAGIVPYSTVRYNTDPAYWRKWIPADLVLECFPGQFRNWFYSLLAMSTMIEGIPPFKTLVGHALVRDEQGEEMHKSKGNAILFDEAAEKMGVDVMRWIFINQSISNHLNFGYGKAREVRGKFFNTLWNTYAFFVNYAEIVNFKPTSQPPVKERPNIDQWIISHLQLLVRKVRKNYEDFDTRMACQSIETFLGKLSNWYIRQTRHRFWKNIDDLNIQAAYETLYECLKTLIQLLAPVIPFITEEIYQNLVRGCDDTAPESIHHTSFPEVNEDLIDEVLIEDMDALIHLTTVALSARASAGIKVRQPLSELIIDSQNRVEWRAAERFKDMLLRELNVKKVTILPEREHISRSLCIIPNFRILGPRFGPKSKLVAEMISSTDAGILREYVDSRKPIEIAINGESIILDGTEFSIKSKAPEGLAISEDGGTTIAIRTVIDEDLKIEGVMRDLLRRLQVLRKDIGLEIEDRITLFFSTQSYLMQKVFDTWMDFIKKELLCVETHEVDYPGEEFKEIAFADERVWVKIMKVNVDKD